MFRSGPPFAPQGSSSGEITIVDGIPIVGPGGEITIIGSNPIVGEGGGVTIVGGSVTLVPLPGDLWLLGAALLSLAGWTRRRRAA